jgi:hypothetical protein
MYGFLARGALQSAQHECLIVAVNFIDFILFLSDFSLNNWALNSSKTPS